MAAAAAMPNKLLDQIPRRLCEASDVVVTPRSMDVTAKATQGW
jgi:hypothetical protein